MELFSGKERDEVNIEDYTEISEEPSSVRKTKIRIEKLRRFTDTDTIIRAVREGHIVFAMINELKNENQDELKHAISKIKTCCVTVDGNIVGVGDQWIIVSPKGVAIER